jgi:hypothetical protein
LRIGGGRSKFEDFKKRGAVIFGEPEAQLKKICRNALWKNLLDQQRFFWTGSGFLFPKPYRCNSFFGGEL